jgi:probable phosphoglycerate mutase
MTQSIAPNTEPEVTRFFFIRHGQTDHNVNKILQGHLNTELNAQGQEQAHKLGTALSAFPFDRIYSSDLKRCQDTASILASALSEPQSITFTSELRERNMGVIEGMHIDDAIAHGAKHGRHYREFGETTNQFGSRLSKFLEFLRRDTKGLQNVAVVTHGGTIRAILRSCGLNEGVVYNTSITIIDLKGDDWDVRVLGDTQHLGEQLQVADQRVR